MSCIMGDVRLRKEGREWVTPVRFGPDGLYLLNEEVGI